MIFLSASLSHSFAYLSPLSTISPLGHISHTPTLVTELGHRDQKRYSFLVGFGVDFQPMENVQKSSIADAIAKIAVLGAL